MQRVVFNAHYLAFCDEAMSGWLREAYGWTAGDDRFDWMLVKALIEWQGSATYGDTLDVDLGVSRWGTTSFDVALQGTVGDRPVFTAAITYVCVVPGSATKTEVPAEIRSALGDAPVDAS